MLAATMTATETYIKQRLISMGLTIDELAREADMSYSQTWDIVTNGFKPGTRIGNIEKIAQVLGVPVIELLNKHKRQS